MLRTLGLFFQAPGSHLFIVLTCLIVAGFAEAISFGAIVPPHPVDHGGFSQGPDIVKLTRQAFAWSGIPMTFGALTAFIAIAMTHLLTSLREDLICRRINALAAKFTVVAITLRFAWNSVAARLYNVSKDKVTLLDGGSKRRSRASAVAPSSIGVGG